ncbi:hypothetical protein [Leeuwenhoekiella sp. LLG6367-2.1]|uniref:hypothetical protein n=1 Tax=Leeuwenhoekiella sp. LLG6367-2.1 TaxID=3160833 RepID=UPI00386ACA52
MLRKEEKINLIREESEKHGITAYEMAKATGMTESGIARILDGTSKNPHNNSINKLLEFVETRIVGKYVVGHPNFTEPQFNEDQSSYEAKTVIAAITGLRNVLEGNQNLMSKAIEMILLNTDEIRDETSGLRKRLKSVDMGINDLSRTVNKSLAARNS